MRSHREYVESFELRRQVTVTQEARQLLQKAQHSTTYRRNVLFALLDRPQRVAVQKFQKKVWLRVKLQSFDENVVDTAEDVFFLDFQLKESRYGHQQAVYYFLAALDYQRWKQGLYKEISGLPAEYWDDDIEFVPTVYWPDGIEHQKRHISFVAFIVFDF